MIYLPFTIGTVPTSSRSPCCISAAASVSAPPSSEGVDFLLQLIYLVREPFDVRRQFFIGVHQFCVVFGQLGQYDIIVGSRCR